MSTVDRIRFAHWMDVHEMNHIGVDSETLWRELDVLESLKRVEEELPQLPEAGAWVRVRLHGMPCDVMVTSVSPDGVTFIGTSDFFTFMSFTISDLLPAE